MSTERVLTAGGSVRRRAPSLNRNVRFRVGLDAHSWRYTAEPCTDSVFSFMETRLFARPVQEYLLDEEYARLQEELVTHPAAGSVIRATGGVRKLRWGVPGRGRRDEFRNICLVRSPMGVIWTLTIYPKIVAASIPPTQVLRQIREGIDGDQESRYWNRDSRRSPGVEGSKVRTRGQCPTCR